MRREDDLSCIEAHRPHVKITPAHFHIVEVARPGSLLERLEEHGVANDSDPLLGSGRYPVAAGLHPGVPIAVGAANARLAQVPLAEGPVPQDLHVGAGKQPLARGPRAPHVAVDDERHALTLHEIPVLELASNAGHLRLANIRKFRVSQHVLDVATQNNAEEIEAHPNSCAVRATTSGECAQALSKGTKTHIPVGLAMPDEYNHLVLPLPIHALQTVAL
mmetsp:Transcript_40873/g.113650  ORF Transcript_40873/g.113650 Transcript_40873/m.113650 type:complete len:219 (-) Transcript_40873:62-718(-)|eukprot:CAMPEP_0179080428 /NCGR_PEP_ID=MMETSP0796-20121207/36147_1 /TAXON_ID=73915 /ORGANISM="Pyrodinium bahamense, Strain pbaha01" /LENGTH=218 /DNA_ID=CAMNT_0020777783 /DNA_START=215 /DNA_END=871 /DNA_ORIENTATION=+